MKNGFFVNFENTKLVLAIFARNFRLFSRAARGRAKLKVRNFVFFLVFIGKKYLQSFKTLATVVLEIDRGGDLHPPRPGLSTNIARLG